MPGHLIDISSSGIGLILEWFLNPGASLAVEWGETIVLGEVVYCVKEDMYFRAGLRTSYIILDRTMSKRQAVFMALHNHEKDRVAAFQSDFLSDFKAW